MKSPGFIFFIFHHRRNWQDSGELDNSEGVVKLRFNLAGLLVATAIIAVLALALLPLALGTQRYMAVEQGAEEMARELQGARQQAVACGETYKVYFSRTDKAYYISPDRAFAPSRRVQLPPGVEMVQLSTNPIFFHGNGRCPTGGTVSLRYHGAAYLVEVVIATHSGRVRLERGAP